jgi:hypothetical protein
MFLKDSILVNLYFKPAAPKKTIFFGFKLNSVHSIVATLQPKE